MGKIKQKLAALFAVVLIICMMSVIQLPAGAAVTAGQQIDETVTF